MKKVITQLQKVKNQDFVLPQYIKVLLKFKAIRAEKVWIDTKSGKKEHRGAFKYYVTETGNQMLNIVL